MRYCSDGDKDETVHWMHAFAVSASAIPQYARPSTVGTISSFILSRRMCARGDRNTHMQCGSNPHFFRSHRSGTALVRALHYRPGKDRPEHTHTALCSLLEKEMMVNSTAAAPILQASSSVASLPPYFLLLEAQRGTAKREWLPSTVTLPPSSTYMHAATVLDNT